MKQTQTQTPATATAATPIAPEVLKAKCDGIKDAIVVVLTDLFWERACAFLNSEEAKNLFMNGEELVISDDFDAPFIARADELEQKWKGEGISQKLLDQLADKADAAYRCKLLAHNWSVDENGVFTPNPLALGGKVIE